MMMMTPIKRSAGRAALLLLLVSALLAQLAACDDTSPRTRPGDTQEETPEVTETSDFAVQEADLQAELSGEQLLVTLPVISRRPNRQNLRAELELIDLEGNALSQTTARLEGLEAGAEGTIQLQLPRSTAQLTQGDAMRYVLRWTVRGDQSEGVAAGRRALFGALRHDQVLLLTSDTFFAGSRAHVRLIAQDATSRTALANRPAVLTLSHDDGTSLRVEGMTDDAGTLSLPLDIPEDAAGSWSLVATVDGRNGPVRQEASIAMRRESRVLLTTDKPFYQPGQLIHVRVLAMRRPALIPEAEVPVTIEIQDAKGNKLARQVAQTDSFGVAHTQLKLGAELNLGAFQITATVGDTTAQRTVTVDRYALPKLRVELDTERPFYAPGDRLHGTVRSGYFFGKPAAGGHVEIKAYKFDTEFASFMELTGTLDAEGAWDFDLDLPTFFVGLPLEQGDAFTRLEISVTDGAGYTQRIARDIPISTRPLLLQAIPASSPLPGQDLEVFALVADPGARPVATSGRLFQGSQAIPFETDARGIARVTIPAALVSARGLQIEATPPGGGTPVTAPVSLSIQAGSHALAVRADQALYKAGDPATVEVHATPALQRIFLDVLKDNQIVLSTAGDVTHGVATFPLDLPADLVGNLQFEAYAITPEGAILRDHALVFVEAATDLRLTVTPERDTYLPGEQATLQVEVTDSDGDGVVSSVGLMVVDEAVFALQDVRPGMEKVFFQLEQEILTPRYTLYSHSPEEVLRGDADTTEAERDEVAALVFASSQGMSAYGVQLDSFNQDLLAALQIAQERQQRDANTLAEALRAGADPEAQDPLAALQRWLDQPTHQRIDPWGNPYSATVGWGTLTLTGRGPDEASGTGDDLNVSVQLHWFSTELPQLGNNATNNADFNNNPANNNWDAGANNEVGNPAPEEGGSEQPRVRSYFPETLYVNPSVITDADGHATVEVPLADSITTWRVTGTASSQDGGLGSYLGGLRVFQEFFVDINFPATLTAADEVTVPIALYNYLDTPQEVLLQVDTPQGDAPWFELLDGDTRTVMLAPGEVRGERFRVRVTRPGWHDFQVTALGEQRSDAVRRRVQVIPDGQERLIDASTSLAELQTFDVDFPADAIDGALSLQFKLYPSVLAQGIEGLDSLLQMPSGCFEQTSSTTYPNILVLQYLRASDQAVPAVEAKALEYINLGYQKLLTFESEGGGFEWFGASPAHRILTAYGLLEFTDMAEVAYVDPAVIARTRAWLLSQQEADGRWRAAQEGIHEGATNNFTDSDLRATAYITYALLESGEADDATLKGLDYLRANLSGASDPYTLALVANALFAGDPQDADGLALAAQLDALKQVDDDGAISWASDSSSFTYGSGSAMEIETTVWVLQALHKAGRYAQTVQGGTTWLIQRKDGFGSWENTQATILTLRFLLESSSSGTQEDANAAVRVFHDDVLVQQLLITPESSDLLRQVDLNAYAHPGLNRVRVEMEGTGNFTAQTTGRYYAPWPDVPAAPAGPLSLEVSYDRTQLQVDEQVTATAEVTNLTDARLDMVMVELGVPPGFDLVLDDLQALVDAGTITRFDQAGRKVILYLYGLEPQQTLTLTWRLQAGEPVRAQTPPSQTYLYYEPTQRAESQPVLFLVEEGG